MNTLSKEEMIELIVSNVDDWDLETLVETTKEFWRSALYDLPLTEVRCQYEEYLKENENAKEENE